MAFMTMYSFPTKVKAEIANKAARLRGKAVAIKAKIDEATAAVMEDVDKYSREFE